MWPCDSDLGTAVGVEDPDAPVDRYGVTTPVSSTDLSDHVEWFKREVAIPGTFATLFPETTDDDLAASLVDGIYAAKLDGWLPGVEADPDQFTTTPALSMPGVALVVIYAGIRFVRNQIKDMLTTTRYKAGATEYETQRSASILSERLKEMTDEKKQLILNAQASRGGSPVFMRDGYQIRVSALYGFELPIYVGSSPAELTQAY